MYFEVYSSSIINLNREYLEYTEKLKGSNFKISIVQTPETIFGCVAFESSAFLNLTVPEIRKSQLTLEQREFELCGTTCM